MLDRVHVGDLAAGRPLEVAGDEFHHLTRVRRRRPGDLVEVFDGHGNAFVARVEEIGPRSVLLLPEGLPLPVRDPQTELTLAVAAPKGERIDWLIEKAVELGVSRLVFLKTERAVVDPRPTKLDRLRRLVVEASKQSGRSRLMEVVETQPWAEFAGTCQARSKWLAHPGGGPLSGLQGMASVGVAIGPEGGWTDDELNLGIKAGWQTFGLGRTILRIETAALAGCAVVLTAAEAGAD